MLFEKHTVLLKKPKKSCFCKHYDGGRKEKPKNKKWLER